MTNYDIVKEKYPDKVKQLESEGYEPSWYSKDERNIGDVCGFIAGNKYAEIFKATGDITYYKNGSKI